AKSTPGADWTVTGMKVPRQQHRDSGRTALRAHINVLEPKEERDEEGSMAYSRGGVPAQKDATVFNTAWAPGWNSNQSVFKFQEEVGGKLLQANHGTRLLKQGGGADRPFFAWQENGEPSLQGLRVFPLYHLFGSEELSAHSPAIQARATSAYVALAPL